MSAKPWEEMYAVHPMDSRCIINPMGRDDVGPVVADIRVPLHDNGREVALLFAASPQMARVLLALGGTRRVTAMEEWHLFDCCRTGASISCSDDCWSAQVALKKAGVL